MSIGIMTIAINLAPDLQVAIFKAMSHGEREARIGDHHHREPSVGAWFKGEALKNLDQEAWKKLGLRVYPSCVVLASKAPHAPPPVKGLTARTSFADFATQILQVDDKLSNQVLVATLVLVHISTQNEIVEAMELVPCRRRWAVVTSVSRRRVAGGCWSATLASGGDGGKWPAVATTIGRRVVASNCWLARYRHVA
ncbi:PREDICTED: PRUPE_4G168400 [Prunus dulcis]|uniref:PREDICTED: PRUPE_4G168400 n=1 Tax=Prunus dulcis TaxID=3755 RepID=A0A5E4FHN2_PRUDU|nr:PREDICTED: PRUPE_4G168400 [Prunus dulcis]